MIRTDLDTAIGVYSDLHKDVFGVRPRGFTTEATTLADIEAKTDEIQAMFEQEMAFDEAEAEFKAAWAASEARWAAFAGDAS